MKRRQFLKSCLIAVTAPTALASMPEPSRAVMWGMAPCDLPAFRYVSLSYRLMRCRDWCNWSPVPTVIVKTAKSIKMGQPLVWYPDGTVRGA